MPTLTSLELAEKLNQTNKRPGVFFLPFARHHADRINVSSEEVLVVTDRSGVGDILDAQSKMGPAVTVFLNSQPVGIFGFVSIWRGVTEAWFVTDERVRTIPMTMTRIGKKVMDIAKISMGLHRIQITVRTHDKRAERWAYAIGFERECVMRKYGPDAVDYFLMARY
jgi:hypothetical protein